MNYMKQRETAPAEFDAEAGKARLPCQFWQDEADPSQEKRSGRRESS